MSIINIIVILLFVLFFADLGYIVYSILKKRKGNGDEK